MQEGDIDPSYNDKIALTKNSKRFALKCRGDFWSQEIDSGHAAEDRSTDGSRRGC
jgi:hypothetical protein